MHGLPQALHALQLHGMQHSRHGQVLLQKHWHGQVLLQKHPQFLLQRHLLAVDLPSALGARLALVARLTRSEPSGAFACALRLCLCSEPLLVL